MINIAELLKDAPTGMKLYSPLFGEVEFAEVMDTDYVPIRVMKRGYGLRFDEYGRYMESRERYGAGEETDKSFHYMVKALEDFIQVLHQEAETSQQKQMLNETLQRSMR